MQPKFVQINMKNVFIVISFLLPLVGSAQNFKRCDTLRSYPFQYYSFDAKYPVSSETLKEQINKTLTPQISINGFITIRFVVNCEGKIGNFEIYEVDDFYKNTQFDKRYTSQILSFVKTLKNWKIATYQNKIYDYSTFLTFKIEHGAVTEVLP